MQEKGSIFELEKYVTAKPQILIGDNGGQYTNLIKKTIEQLGVRAKIIDGSISKSELEKEIDKNEVKGLIWSGGPDSVYSKDAPDFDPRILDLDIPYLGICYGLQQLAVNEGGTVKRKAIREDGQREINADNSKLLQDGLHTVLMNHGDSVDKAPDGYTVTAYSENGLIAALENATKKKYGVQFHPEVNDTPNGKDILNKFVYDICACENNYSMVDRVNNSIKYIKEKVGNNKALVLASGGVDSSVALALALKALGPENVYVVHVDNGFMRRYESEQVYRDILGIAWSVSTKFKEDNMRLIEAAEQFYNARLVIAGKFTPKLNEATDPEVKRNIIGDVFVDIAKQAMKDLGLEEGTYLIQGSLYTDLIESGVEKASIGKTAKIKTHHNAVKKMIDEFGKKGLLVEPNGLWYKDDVRLIGKELGLSPLLVNRHPYPGPGLAIRILCGERPYKKDYSIVSYNLKRSVNSFLDNKIKSEEPVDIQQYDLKAHLVPIRTVGIQGDGRTYDYLALLVGAHYMHLHKNDWRLIKDLAKSITDHNRRINRVAYLIGQDEVPDLSNPKYYYPTHLTKEVIETSRELHFIGEGLLVEHRLTDKIAQMPFVLFNADLSGLGNRSAAIRGLLTSDWMTGRAAVPTLDNITSEFFVNCHHEFMKLTGIGAVVVDVTDKPPGTTCWE